MWGFHPVAAAVHTPAEVVPLILGVWPKHLPPHDHPTFLYNGEHKVVAIL